MGHVTYPAGATLTNGPASAPVREVGEGLQGNVPELRRSSCDRATLCRMRSLFLLVGAAAAVGACTHARPAYKVEGTTWSFCSGDQRVTFLPAGHASFAGHTAAPPPAGVPSGILIPAIAPRDVQCGAAKWSQDGDHVIFDCASFTVYDMHVDGDAMTGQWHRTATPDEHFTTCLRRTDADASLPNAVSRDNSAGVGSSPTTGQIADVVRAHAVEVRQQCWDNHDSSPTTDTENVEITIDDTGHVTRVRASGSDPATAQCLERAIREWQFPSAGAPTTVKVPFRFERK